ncbi:hypothetical protein [Roseiarcus sp.]|uniref:hypothetical protein n=1 Tax=Roseiarcus sp. TaxID=1969460 RepID=UPI003F973488
MNVDKRARFANQKRLRELATRHGDEVKLISSHDPSEFAACRLSAQPTATAGSIFA